MRYGLLILIFSLIGLSLLGQTPVEMDSTSAENTISENPFSVNHVPIRKNQLRDSQQEVFTGKQFVDGQFALIVMLGLLILLAIIVSIKRSYLAALWRCTLRNYAIDEFNHQENGGLSYPSILGYVFALTSIGFFLTLAFHQQLQISDWKMFRLASIGLIAWFVLRHLILWLIRQVFSVHEITKYYSFQVMLWNVMAGLLIFVFSIFLAYGPIEWQQYIIYIGFAIIGIALILRTFRTSTYIIDAIRKSPFQIFLYLCASEIAPILILAQLFQ